MTNERDKSPPWIATPTPIFRTVRDADGNKLSGIAMRRKVNGIVEWRAATPDELRQFTEDNAW